MDAEHQTTETADWYREGLRFSCRQCHHCCGGEPGYIWVSSEDVGRMARHIGMDVESFVFEYLRKSQGRLSLIERADGFCVMHTGRGCRVYEVRPGQCVKYPFWSRILASADDWNREARGCPGMNQGPFFGAADISQRTWKNL